MRLLSGKNLVKFRSKKSLIESVVCAHFVIFSCILYLDNFVCQEFVFAAAGCLKAGQHMP